MWGQHCKFAADMKYVAYQEHTTTTLAISAWSLLERPRGIAKWKCVRSLEAKDQLPRKTAESGTSASQRIFPSGSFGSPGKNLVKKSRQNSLRFFISTAAVVLAVWKHSDNKVTPRCQSIDRYTGHWQRHRYQYLLRDWRKSRFYSRHKITTISALQK